MEISRNLELVLVSTGSVMWQTQTMNSEIYQAVLQLDGSLVLSNQNGSKSYWTYNSHTPGASLHLKNDGNLVMISPNGIVVWETKTMTACAGICIKIKFTDTAPGLNLTNIFTLSFYARRSRKCKNTDNLTVFFTHLGSSRVKVVRRKLMKSTPRAIPTCLGCHIIVDQI